MAVPLPRDAQLFKAHFTVNHVGHFRPVRRQWPVLQKPRVQESFQFSSWGNRHSPVVFEYREGSRCHALCN
jgi:hypothetical protein